MRLIILGAVALWLNGAVVLAATPATTMALCRNAAIASADKHGVPRDVMLAITLVETRTRRGGVSGPWPWTVNVAGKGGWFQSRAAALLHAQSALSRGETSFDVGCFQLNYRWHGMHFASIDQMFEPGPSGDYAARFLKDLHAETGDWIKASGHYHSRTPVHAKRYRGLVARAVASMNGKIPEPTIVAQAPPANRVQRVSDARTLWPLQKGQIRVPRQPGSTPGAVSLNLLRQPSGGLLRRGSARAGG